jgi:isocitrate/isopropylmalate dehydrogenase
MLDYLGHQNAANKIRVATGEVLRAGRVLTRDVGGKASTEDVTRAIVSAMSRG